MTTISASTSKEIILDPKYYSNPIVITAGVVIGAGIVVGATGATFNIQNNGVVNGGGADAIRLAGGSVTNASSASIIGQPNGVYFSYAGAVFNSGSISATSAGAFLFAGGYVTNSPSASIVGLYDGVDILHATGTVVNAGTIAATGTGDVSIGVYLGAGGTIINTTSGLITGIDTGIGGAGKNVTVNNAGRVTASGTLGTGVLLQTSSSITNDASGTITGSDMGLNIQDGSADTVLNQGTIIGSASDGVAFVDIILTYPDAVTITNAASAAIIGGAFGAFFKGLGGTLDNSGSIGVTGSTGIGVYMDPVGSITNETSASIIGGAAGVAMKYAAGTVINKGTIAAKENIFGIAVQLSHGGTVSNAASASIAGQLYGIEIQGGVGTVVNAGSITAISGIYLQAGGTVTNAASGSITADSSGIKLAGTATAINQGSIAGDSFGSGIYALAGALVTNGAGGTIAVGAYGVIFKMGGTVTNAASASITGGKAGVRFLASSSTAGTVINSGIITATSASGIGVALDSGGTVTNNAGASITGRSDGVRIAGTSYAVVVNSGSIAATGTYPSSQLVYLGVYLATGGTVTNNTGASIFGFKGGVRISGASAGTVINSGRIAVTGSNDFHFGGYLGVDLASGGTVINNASASISGVNGAVRIAGGYAAVVVNSGSITASEGDGLSLASGGTVTNNAGASIIAYANGIDSAKYVHVQNGGTIIGSGRAAISIGQGGYVTNAASGVIVGGIYGVVIATAAGTVVNAGSIAGGSTIGGVGVELQAGGSVSNAASASIAGVTFGVVLTAAGTVANYGSITGGASTSGAGVVMAVGGLVTNGTIGSPGYIGSNVDGVDIKGSDGTVVNFGSIKGGGRYGVYLNAGGSVTNATSAAITGGTDGVLIAGHAGTVVNIGHVVAGNDGVALTKGGSVVNSALGSIAAVNFGVTIAGSTGTLFNYGNIGGGPDGVVLGAGGSVTNAGGGSISGLVNGVYLSSGGSVINRSSSSITGYHGFGVYLKTAGSVVDAASASIIGGKIGAYLKAGGTLTTGGSITGNGGTAVAFGGSGSNRLVLLPGYAMTGQVTAAASASNTLELASAVSTGTVDGLGTKFLNFGPIVFDSGSDWTISGNTAGLAGTISGLVLGDIVEVTGFQGTGNSSFASGVLTLSGSGGIVTLHLAGLPDTQKFRVVIEGNNTDVSLGLAPCFGTGTRLLAASGEVAVEALVPGDLLVTLSGRLRPVRWIGHRRVDARHHPRPYDVYPVRIAADAFAPGMPHRDLLLSPDHSVFVDGALIPIRYLVNGATVRQESVAEVAYLHVELDRHDVLLAEGLPAESYLDTGDRLNFANGGAAVVLHPDFAARKWEAEGCAPLIITGPALDAVRQRVNLRAAIKGAVPQQTNVQATYAA